MIFGDARQFRDRKDEFGQTTRRFSKNEKVTVKIGTKKFCLSILLDEANGIDHILRKVVP